MKIPDHHTTKLGSRDFVFQVNKWPFSITCNPLLPKITESFIDLALVKDMKISMKKVECRNISYGGLQTKLVGSISQTIQVVYDGVASGTMHLKAKVIRNLSNLYGVDCIAGQKLYKLLTRPDSVSDLENASHTGNSDAEMSEAEVSEAEESETPTEHSSDDIIFNGDDTPQTRRRKRRKRFSIANLSFTSSMNSPPSSPRASSPIPSPKPTQVQNPIFKSNSLTTGKTAQPSTMTAVPPKPSTVKLRQAIPIPTPTPSLPDAPCQLQDLIFCGHHQPCPCLDILRIQQLHLLPPFYPVYLPVGHQPCCQDCGSHRVHKDNLHPPNPTICPCSPPRLSQTLSSHSQAVQLVPAQHEEPPLPADFVPCGNRCQYELCECLRYYEGRDWDS